MQYAARRQYLPMISIIVSFFLLSAPSLYARTPQDLSHDGFLRLYHSHLGDFLELTYEINGKIDPNAIKKFNYFMRSRDSGSEITMNGDMIYLLDHLQDHFGADTVEIISGYRSPDFNHHLKVTGHNVSENSFHMRGMATDVHLDEISEKTIQNYFRGLHLGGVGYYPDLLMVHLDRGPVHFWQEDSFSDRTNIGIFTNSSLKIKTDHLFYLSGKTLHLTLSNPQKKKLAPMIAVQGFYRGQWSPVLSFTKNSFPDSFKIKGLSSRKPKIEDQILHLPWGKYRFLFSTDSGETQYSNEFYVKKM